jgi:dihydroflavonol-4-reductase
LTLPEKILLTGATGHLGTAVAAEVLARDGPGRLRLLIRSEAKLRRLAGLDPRLAGLVDCERVVGDVRDPATVAAALAGADALVHALHSHEYWRGTAHLLDVNLEGAQRLIAALGEGSAVQEVVYVGSYSVHDAADGPPREALERQAARAASSAVKATVQRLFSAAASAGGFRLHVVSPSYMIGPYQLDPTFFGALFHLVRFRPLRWCPPHGVNLVDVRDVARAVVDRLEDCGRPPRRVLAGGDDVPFRDLFTAMNRAGGHERSPRELPVRLLRSLPRLRYFGDFGKFYFDRPHYVGAPGLPDRRHSLEGSVADAVDWAGRMAMFTGAFDIARWLAKRYL